MQVIAYGPHVKDGRGTWNVTFPISRKLFFFIINHSISLLKETFISTFNHQSEKADELSAQGRTGPERQEHAGMPPRRGVRGGALGHRPSLEVLGCGVPGPKGEAEQTSAANACFYAETRPRVHCTAGMRPVFWAASSGLGEREPFE